MKLAWACDKCHWLQVSDSKLHHQMDHCKCKETAVDLEEGYGRMIGFPRVIAVLEKGKRWRVKLSRLKKAVK